MSEIDKMLKALDEVANASSGRTLPAILFAQDHGETIRTMAQMCKQAGPVEMEAEGGGRFWHCMWCEMDGGKRDTIDHSPDCAWVALEKEME